MKQLWVIACVSVLSSSAFAGFPMGRGGDLGVEVLSSATYDSNIQGRNGGDDDVYGTFAPRLSYTRRAGLIGADASVGVSSERYVDHHEFNSDNFLANATLSLADKSYQNINATVTASYTEGYTVDQDINARINSHTVAANGDFGFALGSRMHVDTNASFTNSHRHGASDQQFFTGGTDFGYSDFIYETALHFSYTYTRSTSSGENVRGADIDQNSHLFSLGLSRPLLQDVNGRINYGYRILNRAADETAQGQTRQTGTVFSASVDGPFLPAHMFPKLKSHASISYENATTPGVNDPGSKQISGDIGLTWEARPTTSVSLGVTRSQRLAVSDLTVVSTDAHLSVDQKLRFNLSANAEVGYTWNTYKSTSRSDEVLLADAGLAYTVGANWSANASYRYQRSTSGLALAAYDHHVAMLSVAYHY